MDWADLLWKRKLHNEAALCKDLLYILQLARPIDHDLNSNWSKEHGFQVKPHFNFTCNKS